MWQRLGILALAAALGGGTSGEAQSDGRKVTHRVQPSYPPIARKMNLQGAVKVEVVVEPSGRIRETRVLGGHPVLADAATEAVKRWRYEPAAATTTVVVEFKFSATAQ